MENLEHKLHSIGKIIFKIITPNWSWSWFYLKSHDLIVTNYHVVKWFKQLFVEDNEKNRIIWKVIMINSFNDIAFIKLETNNICKLDLEIWDATKLSSRDEVYVLWYPFWLPYTITKWIISSTDQIINWKNLIQTDAAVNPWNSWWAIVNSTWELIWITVSKFIGENTDNMWFWIPVNFLLEDLDSVSKKDNTDFWIKCDSCNELIYKKLTYCKKCWNWIDKDLFDEYEISQTSKIIENVITNIWINPIITRSSFEFWSFYYKNKLVKIYIDSDWYINLSSFLFKIINNKLENFYKYRLSNELKPFKLCSHDDELLLRYTIHISDLLSSNKDEYINNMTLFFSQIDKIITFLTNNFEVKNSKFDKKN